MSETTKPVPEVNSGEQPVLLHKDIVFPRAFRFTVESSHTDRLTTLVQRAEYNLIKKTFTLVLYEVIRDEKDENIALDYVALVTGSRMHDNFRLKSYDGMGHTLCEHTFDRCRAVDHHAAYNYDKSDLISHTLVFEFDHFKHINLAHLPSEPIPMGMNFANQSFTIKK